MSCNYCPKTYKCLCPPKCVKCCHAARIYRSTIHTLHDAPQPQHSWPWTPRTLETNSDSWTVTIPSLTKDSKIHRNELVKIVQNGDQQWQPISKPVIDVSNGDEWQLSKTVIDVSNGDEWQPSKIEKDVQNGDQQLTIPPLMSLTLTRKEKKRRKTRIKKKKKQNDLRLLLDEKKNTQKQSENFIFCTKDNNIF